MAMPAFKPLLIMSICIWLPMLASLPDAVNFSRALQTTLVFLRFPLAAIFAISTLQAMEARRCLSWLLGLALSFAAVCVVIVTLHGHANNVTNGLVAALSTVSGTRAIGHILAVLSPIYFYWSWRIGQQRRWIWLVAPTIYTAAILFTGARVAWIMLMASVVLGVAQLVFIEKVRWRWKPVIALVLFLGLAMGVAIQQDAVLKNKVERTVGLFSGNYEQTNTATSNRLPIWTVAYHIAQDHWVNGIGPRGFRYIYLDYYLKYVAHVEKENSAEFIASHRFEIFTHPHQLFLEIAAETGLIGVIGYLMALFYWLRLTLAAWRQKMSPALPWMAAVLIAIMPVNAHMAFYASFWSCMTWWLVMLSLAFWQISRPEKT
jgi:O-antigen ligase